MSARRVAVTGLGAVSGFGAGVDRLWSALVDGRRATAPLTATRLAALRGAALTSSPDPARRDPPLAPALDPLRCGPVAIVPDLPLDAPERALRLALLAAHEAAADAGGLPSGPRLGVLCGTTLGAIDHFLTHVRADYNGLTNSPMAAQATVAMVKPFSYGAPAHAVAAALGAAGPVATTSVACASGNAALGAALDLIRDGTCDVVVAGGVDALDDFVLAGFGALKAIDPEPCRPFDRARRGLNLGEGAAFLVLEAEPHARARGARIRAFLDGYGLAADAVHMTGPDREGRGAARAMRLAVEDAGLGVGAIELVSAHGTATPFNDLMEAKALATLFGARAPTVPVHSIKSALGHTLGAAGALEALVCVRALETGLVPPTVGLTELDPEIALDVVRGGARAVRPRAVLSTSSGFGGANAAVVLRAANG